MKSCKKLAKPFAVLAAASLLGASGADGSAAQVKVTATDGGLRIVKDGAILDVGARPTTCALCW